MNTKITLTDRAIPELRRIAEQLLNPEALYKDVGRRAANDLRKHYAALDAGQPNALGGNRTHFWNEVRDSVQQPQLEGDGVSIAITHPVIAAKIYGAIITAKNASALTIPINQLAYGRRASVFEDETGKKLFRPKGKNVLMAEIGGKAVPIYALVKQVYMHPDIEALPLEAEFDANIIATGKAHLARMLARVS
ncbi:hypothetical protein BH09VER1_BH09VER1_24630 [soil metagenome]